MSTKAEQETVIRWDQEERRVWLWTAYEPEARRWQRLGYSVEVRQTRGGEPTGWRARAPLGAVKLRALGPGGEVRKRAQSGGKPFGRAIAAGPDDRTPAGAPDV